MVFNHLSYRRVLLETEEMLEEQLQRARKRGDHVLELESEIIKYKQQLNDMTLEKEANQERLQELFEENAQLQMLTKSALNENTVLDIEVDNMEDLDGGMLWRFISQVCPIKVSLSLEKEIVGKTRVKFALA